MDLPLDKISIKDLRLMILCGILPEELEREQPFSLDIDLYIDLSGFSSASSLEDSVDYGSVIDKVSSLIEGKYFELMETLANEITTTILNSFKVSAVTLTVKKLRPPLPSDLEYASVRMSRKI